MQSLRHRSSSGSHPYLISLSICHWTFSWTQGKGCGQEEFPGVYARVSSSIGFIEDAICDNSDSPPKYCKSKPKANYRVDIQYDAWPEDIEWSILTEDESEVIVESSGNANLFELESVYVDLDGGNYIFRISDTGGFKDGMTVDMNGTYVLRCYRARLFWRNGFLFINPLMCLLHRRLLSSSGRRGE